MADGIDGRWPKESMADGRLKLFTYRNLINLNKFQLHSKLLFINYHRFHRPSISSAIGHRNSVL
jgi:hypothetical protein